VYTGGESGSRRAKAAGALNTRVKKDKESTYGFFQPGVQQTRDLFRSDISMEHQGACALAPTERTINTPATGCASAGYPETELFMALWRVYAA